MYVCIVKILTPLNLVPPTTTTNLDRRLCRCCCCCDSNEANITITLTLYRYGAVPYDELLSKSKGQYRITNTMKRAGKTIRDILSISRHNIRSAPVSVSVQATDNKLCLRAGFGGPFPLPCSDVWPGVVGVSVAFRALTDAGPLVPASHVATVWHWPFSMALIRC